MANIFADTSSTWGAAQKADAATLILAGGATGLIVQQLDINASRPVTTLYDLTSLAVYYVGGRATTAITLNRVCGPVGLMSTFYVEYGDVCKADQNTVVFILPSACNPVSPNILMIWDCVLINVVFSVNVQNYVVAENCQITGTDCMYV